MRRWLVGAALFLLITGFFWKADRVEAYGPGQQAAVPSTGNKPLPKGYAGSDTCAPCHQEISDKFSVNPHTRMALMHNATAATCENCHGPGQAHIDSGGDVTKLFRFSKATAKEIDDKCLGCHAAAHQSFERSAHGEAGVSCTSCHTMHKFETEQGLLKVSQPKLCYTCHTDVRPTFSLPFHHRVDEGLLACSDCHNPHGTFKRKLLKSNADENAICTKCHAETLGPFVYEHPPLKVEGCTYCHAPHGSPNPRLLIRNNVNSLCLQCHSASFDFTAPGVPSFHNQANQYQACTVCHTQIHGSNTSFVFFR